MLGTIIGDIVGSRFEWDNIKSKNFYLFTDKSEFTDDSVMTLAVAKALINWKKTRRQLERNVINQMRSLGRKYPFAGYGGMFSNWLTSSNPRPYNSYGNGAAMRVSPVAYAANSIEEVKELSKRVTAVTHNHPEGIKGAEATAVAIYLAICNTNISEIKEVIVRDYYNIDFTLDEIRDHYYFNETCQETVPQALQAFFESKDFEDAIRGAVSIGGDSDTLAAICGGVAEAYYGIPKDIKEKAYSYLDAGLIAIIKEFQIVFGSYDK